MYTPLKVSSRYTDVNSHDSKGIVPILGNQRGGEGESLKCLCMIMGEEDGVGLIMTQKNN